MSENLLSPDPSQSQGNDPQSAPMTPQPTPPLQNYQAPQAMQVPQQPQYQQQPVMPNQTINVGGVVVVQGNGMATAALILGIISVLFALIPFLGIFIASPCSLLAFIFGIVGMVRGSKIHKGFGLALCGLLLSLLSSLMMLLVGGTVW